MNPKHLITLALLSLSSVALSAPQSLVTCNVAADEMAIDLLSRSGQLSRLVGVSKFALDPRYSNLTQLPPHTKTRCGDDLESLIRAKPALVITAFFNKPEWSDRLRDAHIKVRSLTSFNRLSDIRAALIDLGTWLELPDFGVQAAAEFDKELGKIRSRSLGKTSVKVLEYLPGFYVSGQDTPFDDLIKTVGGVNVASEAGLKGWPKVQAEKLIGLKPDVIIAAGSPAEKEQLLKSLRSEPAYKSMPAVQKGLIVMIPQNQLSAFSPHVLKALEKIEEALHAN